jgi:hypothetical protein
VPKRRAEVAAILGDPVVTLVLLPPHIEAGHPQLPVYDQGGAGRSTPWRTTSTPTRLAGRTGEGRNRPCSPRGRAHRIWPPSSGDSDGDGGSDPRGSANGRKGMVRRREGNKKARRDGRAGLVWVQRVGKRGGAVRKVFGFWRKQFLTPIFIVLAGFV